MTIFFNAFMRVSGTLRAKSAIVPEFGSAHRTNPDLHRYVSRKPCSLDIIERMTDNKHLLLVAHAPSPNTRKLVEATLRGARHADISGVDAKHIPPLEAEAADVLRADAIILGTTENFGYMSGALKDFFDRIYYPCLEHTEAMPYAAWIRAGLDGTGTRIAIGKITTGLKWKAVQEAMILHGEYRDEFEQQCEELGMLMAASLEAGII